MQIMINSANEILLEEQGKLVEKISDFSKIIGNIYKGRIVRMLKSVNALSIDIGEKRLGFLPVADTVCFTQGQELLVQVTAEPKYDKGARLSSEISLAGFNAILLMGETNCKIGVSKKINDDSKRLLLKHMAKRHVAPEHGAIVRSRAANCSESEFISEIKLLVDWAEHIEHDFKFFSAPKLLYDANNLGSIVRRMYVDASIDVITVSSVEIKERILPWLPITAHDIVTVNNAETKFNLLGKDGESDIMNTLPCRIALPCGGNIKIEQTEALTVIDVNSGSCVAADKSETAMRVNLEAVVEIARQLRLKNISGMIIIDFIDIFEQANRDLITEELKQRLTNDPARCKLFGFTALGLFEMTRKSRT